MPDSLAGILVLRRPSTWRLLFQTARIRFDMLGALTTIPSEDFKNLYQSPSEITKSTRRTREWTIPQLRAAQISSGRILSLGCGNGADVMEMRSAGYDALGIDLYPPIPEARPWFKLAPAWELPFPAQSFDAVVCLEVIEHIPHEKRSDTATEMKRIIRPGGAIILATPNRFFPVDEHAAFLRLHSPFRDDTLSCAEIEQLFGLHAQTLSWKKYFQFARFGKAEKLLHWSIAMFDIPVLHRSALNPHLFLLLRL